MVRAPPRVLPPSLAPSGVLGGGGGPVPFSPTWLGVVGAAFTGDSGIPPTGFGSPIGFNLGTEGGESSSERSVLSVGTVGEIDGEARTT